MILQGAAAADTDQGGDADATQLLHGDGGRCAADAGGDGQDFDAVELAAQRAEFTVLPQRLDLRQKAGDVLNALRIAGQQRIACLGHRAAQADVRL